MEAWKDGQLFKASELTVSAYDHGFLYGLGFFETFRTYNGEVFLWDEHWSRLSKALSDFRIAIPYEKQSILKAVNLLTAANNGEDGYFRLNVSAGIHDMGLQPSDYPQPTVIIFRKPLPSTVRGKEKSAIWLKTVRNSPESSIRHKSHHFANNVQARFEIDSLATQEGIFVNAEGFVAEGITSNVFWVKDGKVYTPSVETGILNGTTRKWILKNCTMDIAEGLYTKSQLELADEVFITNAVQEIVPIKSIGEKQFLGNQGPVYKVLHKQYVECIEGERRT
ncbi:aminodeoxychorismate lyase [Psychrobacillus sp. FSL K6-2684]|uniref:aminodeoxychorismate lyase n=1 Tax=Psychrobacillus sp. FSL K6-2684 TaxID=2921547 RepID=UPI0030F504BD